MEGFLCFTGKRKMQTVIKIIVCLIAGVGAGFGTGFAGMSAAAVISPMLITFLDMDPYLAVGKIGRAHV